MSDKDFGSNRQGDLPTEQTLPPVVALFRHCEADERWMLEAYGRAEFEKLSAEGHAGLAEALLRDALDRDKAGQPGVADRIRAASNFIQTAVAIRATTVRAKSMPKDEVLTQRALRAGASCIGGGSCFSADERLATARAVWEAMNGAMK